MNLRPGKPQAGKGDLSFLLRKGGLAFLLRALTMLGQYLLVFTIARLYGPRELGSLTISLTVLQLAAILAQLGLDNRLVRVIAANGNPPQLNPIRTAYTQSVRITSVASLFIAVLLFISAPWLSDALFQKPWLTKSFRIIACALIPFVLMGLNGAAFRGLKNMTGFLLFRALIPFFAVIPLLLFQNSGTITATEAYAYATILLCVLSFITWFKYSSIDKGKFEPVQNSKEILIDSFPMMLTGSVFFLLNWTDNLLLGIFRTEAEVGIYDSAFKIASASAIVLMGLNSIQAPSFSELFAKNKITELNRQVQQSTRLIFLITLPFTILLFLFGEEILGLFGSEFRMAKNALLVLAAGNFISCISGSVGILLQMTGHQRSYNRIITTTAIGSIVLNLYLIPRYGIMGAAFTGCLAKVFQNLGAVIYAYRKMGILTLYLPGISRILPSKKQQTP